MNLGRIWDIVHSELKKESRGNILKPDDFTDILQECHLEYFNEQYEKWAVSQTAYDSLRPFLITDDAVTFAGTTVTIASLRSGSGEGDYVHMDSARMSSDDSKIRIVTPAQWNEWAGDALYKATTSYRMLKVDGTNIHLSPTLSGDILLTYLINCELDTSPYDSSDTGKFYLPFFDYYTDANDEIQYLTNGQSYALQTDEVYRDGTTSGSVTGVSHELKWGSQDIPNIVSKILEKLGIALQSPDITQYAMALEQKQNVV